MIDNATEHSPRNRGIVGQAGRAPFTANIEHSCGCGRLSMLSIVFRSSRASASIVRASPGCVLRVQESVSRLLHSAEAPQAPDSKQDSTSETTRDPFLAHLQQKTEKELFEILRKQQQQPSTQDDDEEISVLDLMKDSTGCNSPPCLPAYVVVL